LLGLFVSYLCKLIENNLLEIKGIGDKRHVFRSRNEDDRRGKRLTLGAVTEGIGISKEY
jgi:argininosuccinate lyase